MSLGPMMVGIAGTELTGEERRRLRHPAIGGVLLFSRNYESPEQVAALTGAIHALRRPSLLVAVDQEGGRVQRFQTGFTRLPPLGNLGALRAGDPRGAEALAGEMAWLMASELRAVGVDFSFAPVVDLDRGISRVIGDRAFGADPEAVYRLARAWRLGAREAGMISVAKHFPGHGGCAPDSHVELPTDSRGYADLHDDIHPFRRLIDNGLEGAMMAHVVYPAVDGRPASFSRPWIEGVLRGRLGFQGCVFSDDLGMNAALGEGTLTERTLAALDAGCDMALACNEGAAVDPVLARVPSLPTGAMRLARLHGRAGRSWPELQRDGRWRRAVDTAERLCQN